ncbi:uncharacterized protein LOC129952765 [Eupeodes corollae]|uniref:uncharacterized protein LOC129952765 n=1 Tax=Eupeodes corollae TaxID=290404 RepID=UPI00248F7E7B|nr:uncharacterized protein LOC129952765 [Eupeodes corollae]
MLHTKQSGPETSGNSLFVLLKTFSELKWKYFHWCSSNAIPIYIIMDIDLYMVMDLNIMEALVCTTARDWAIVLHGTTMEIFIDKQTLYSNFKQQQLNVLDCIPGRYSKKSHQNYKNA